jgi:hypothetical protein
VKLADLALPLPPPAFVTPDAVTTTWEALRGRGRASSEVDDHLTSLGVVDPANTMRGRVAPLDVEDLAVFPSLNLANDVNAPTCTRDLPLRAWLKGRLRERGPALVVPAFSFARDVVVNLHIRYLRDGRRDWLRGAGLVDGDAPIGFGDAPLAVRAKRVTLCDDVVATLIALSAAQADSGVVVGALEPKARDGTAAWLRVHGGDPT